jgi:hypothetical protein
MHFRQTTLVFMISSPNQECRVTVKNSYRFYNPIHVAKNIYLFKRSVRAYATSVYMCDAFRPREM